MVITRNGVEYALTPDELLRAADELHMLDMRDDVKSALTEMIDDGDIELDTSRYPDGEIDNDVLDKITKAADNSFSDNNAYIDAYWDIIKSAIRRVGTPMLTRMDEATVAEFYPAFHQCRDFNMFMHAGLDNATLCHVGEVLAAYSCGDLSLEFPMDYDTDIAEYPIDLDGPAYTDDGEPISAFYGYTVDEKTGRYNASYSKPVIVDWACDGTRLLRYTNFDTGSYDLNKKQWRIPLL